MATLPSPTPPALFYKQRLMQLRKSYDVFPWIETYRKVWGPWANYATPPQKDTIQHKQPRDLFVSELVHSNYLAAVMLDTGNYFVRDARSIPWQAQLTREDGTADSSDLLPADQAFGTAEGELKRFRTGMRIPSQEVRTVIALGSTPTGAIPSDFPAGYEYALALGLRGYQLYKKESNPVPQYTYAEYAERGYASEYRVNVIRVPLVANTTNEMPTGVFQLPTDFATDYITVSLDFQPRTYPADPPVTFGGGDPGLMSFLDVKLEAPGRPIMADFCSAPLVGHLLSRTAWLWDQPLSARKGDEWKVRVKSRLPLKWPEYLGYYGTGAQLIIGLHGHALTKV